MSDYRQSHSDYWKPAPDFQQQEIDALMNADQSAPLQARRRFSLGESARFLGLQEKTLYKYQERGQLPPADMEEDGQPYYFLSTLLHWDTNRNRKPGRPKRAG